MIAFNTSIELVQPLKAEGADCANCPLAASPCAPTYVPANFDGTLFVGEAPGFDEAQQHVPFVGASGQFLARAYESVGGVWGTAARTNTVLCRPPGNRTPTQQEITCCSGRLKVDIARIQPQRIVTLGTPARETVSQYGSALVKEGAWGITRFAGHQANTIGVVHPAFILRQPGAAPRFRRALERVAKGPGGDPTEASLHNPPDITVVRTYSELKEVLDSIADNAWVAYDLETNQTRWYNRRFGSGETYRADRILCLALTTGIGYGWIVPDYLIHDTPAAIPLLTAFFARVRTITHNGKFDLQFLRAYGITSHIDIDTMVAHYTTDETPNTHALKPLVAAEFGVPDYEGDLIAKYLKNKGDVYSKIPELPLYTYAVWDVCSTIALAMRLKTTLVRQKLWERPFQSLMMPGFRTLANIEFRGVRVDVPYLLKWKDLFEKRAEYLRAQITAYTGREVFNPGSPPQMQWLIFTKLGLPITEPVPQSSGRGVTKRGSTSKDALKQLKGMHPVIDLIGEYRTCIKMLKTYIMGMLTYADEYDRVHTSYSNTTTETGRLASRGPALQNIPKGRTLYGQIIRAAFIPSDGCVFLDADYAQAELRVFAAETKDPFLLKVYQNDEDLHEQVVIAQWGPIEAMTDMEYENRRFIAKIFNFGWAYGGGASMLTNVVPDHAAAQAFVDEYEANMPVAAAWRRRQGYLAQKQGYVQARTGRRRRNLNGTLKPTEAINSPVQGGASDNTVDATIRLEAEQRVQVVLLIHDEIVAEAPIASAEADLQYVIDVMQEAGARNYPEVPWKADGKIKQRWAKELTEEEARQWVTSEVDTVVVEEDMDDGEEG